MYAFQTLDGRRVHVTEPEQSNWRPDVGTTATVSYRSTDPQRARIVPDTDWAPFGAMASGGLIAAAGAVTVGVRVATLIAGVRLLGSAAARRRPQTR